jgi:hypothetical protein
MQAPGVVQRSSTNAKLNEEIDTQLHVVQLTASLPKSDRLLVRWS